MANRFLLVLLALLAATTLAEDTDNETCLECHSDNEIMEGKGLVDPKVFKASAHGNVECISCHYELEETEYPHATGLERVDCAECHEKQGEQHANSGHGKAAGRGDALAPTCRACHGNHDILPHTDPKASTYFFNVPLLCARCHKEGSEVTLTHDLGQDEVFKHYSQSMHGDGVYRKGIDKTAVCTSCHTSHEIRPHEDPKSSIHPDNVAQTCMQCHALIERVHRRYVEGKLWEEKPGEPPACVECHPPHRLLDEEYASSAQDQNCQRCHDNPKLSMERDGKVIPLHVDPAELALSAHSKHGITCAQCHADVDFTRERDCETIKSKVDCGVCHESEVADYTSGTHGRLRAQGDPDAPSCLDCHEKHSVKDKRSPISPSFPRNVPALCSRCHREGEKASRRIHSPLGDIVGSYEMSIHGLGLDKSGLTVTATCSSCHTPHKELPADNPESSVHSDNIADTCGQCHHGIEETFRGLPHLPRNLADRRGGVPGPDDGSVRPLPHRGGLDLLRHLPRQGIPRSRRRGEVLRLPRHPQHPADHGSRFHVEPRQRGGDLWPVPQRITPALRRLPHPRHAPRQGEVPVALLVVLVHDEPARGDPRLLPAAHRRLARAALALAG
ncbi:MAG: cytochrome c3 family protein [Planctomycetota bacterium]|jgi:hypothetical protein